MRDVNRNADRTGCFAQNSKALGNAGCVCQKWIGQRKAQVNNRSFLSRKNLYNLENSTYTKDS